MHRLKPDVFGFLNNNNAEYSAPINMAAVQKRVECDLSLCLASLVLQLQHRAITLTQDELHAALSHSDLEQMWQRDLRPLLVTRYPGSAGSQAVQEVRSQALTAGT